MVYYSVTPFVSGAPPPKTNPGSAPGKCLLNVGSFYAQKGFHFLKKIVKMALRPLTRSVNKIDIDLFLNYNFEIAALAAVLRVLHPHPNK